MKLRRICNSGSSNNTLFELGTVQEYAMKNHSMCGILSLYS